MSAIRVPRTRRENAVQQRDVTLPGRRPASRPGPHLDQNVLAGYAAVALALILDPSGRLFFDAARPCPFHKFELHEIGKLVLRKKSIRR